MVPCSQTILTSALALVAAGFLATPLAANPAMLLSSTICDNQRDSFDYFWVQGNNAGTLLYFIDDGGTVRPVGHATAFDTQTDLQITIHGLVNSVGPFSGAEFAVAILAAHPATPASVQMNVCFGSEVPPGGVSSMAQLARAYPGEAANSTRIPAVSAPSAACSLRASPTNDPFVPVAALADAVYRSNVGHTAAYLGQLNALLAAWSDVDTPYPGTDPARSYKDYCLAQPVDNPDAWLVDFLNNVNAEFGVAYLALINTNFGGDAYVACGADVQCN